MFRTGQEPKVGAGLHVNLVQPDGICTIMQSSASGNLNRSAISKLDSTAGTSTVSHVKYQLLSHLEDISVRHIENELHLFALHYIYIYLVALSNSSPHGITTQLVQNATRHQCSCG